MAGTQCLFIIPPGTITTYNDNPLGMSSTSSRHYSVLYFKRTNKVHKFRGTTREDGILIVNPPPSCVCKLVSADNIVNDVDEEEDEKKGGGGAMKKRAYSAFKKGGGSKQAAMKSLSERGGGTATVVWSGVIPDLSRRAHSLLGVSAGTKGTIEADDTLVLSGQWECVIVSSIDDGVICPPSSSRAPLSALQKKATPVGFAGAGTTVVRRTLGCPTTTVARQQVAHRGGGNTIPSTPSTRVTTVGVTRKGLGVVGATRTRFGSTATPTSSDIGPTRVPSNSMSRDDDDDDDDSDKKKEALDRERMRRARMLQKFASEKNTLSSRASSTSVAAPPPFLKVVVSKNDRDIFVDDGGDVFPGAKGERINVPSHVRGVLRPHQREGIVFLWNCVTGVNEGIKTAYENSMIANSVKGDNSIDESDADDVDVVGGGNCKKVCIVPKVENVPRGAVLADEMGLGKTLMTISTIYAYHRLHRDRRFIVVCPSSLVSTWSKEFDKWLGKASQPKRIVIRNGAESEGLRNLKSFVPLKPNHSEVLILSYEIFRLHVKVIETSQKIGILVVDEGHRLKNASGSQILTALNSISVESRILISGTPVQNNLSEFWNMANFAVPGILGDLAAFRRIYDRPMSLSNQKNASAVELAKGRKQAKALEAITSHFVLRRLQKDILNKLLKKRTEVLLFCRPTEIQCQFYQSISERASLSIAGDTDACNTPLMLLTELRKLCTHPALLNGDKAVEDASLSGKMVVLGNLLDSIRRLNPTDKVVIISNFTSALTVVEDLLLRKKGLSFVRLDGSTDSKLRGAIVDTFNRGSVDSSFAFLLSSKAGGCGLNLIGANRLIMVDADWNPATDHQAMARIFREGQTKPCFIYRMFTTGTVEEVIYQRQLQKRNLAKLANDGGNSTNSASFSKEELRDCFTLKRDCKCDTKRKLGKKWSELNVDGCEDRPLLQICEDPNVTFVREVEQFDVDDVDADFSDAKSERSFSEEEEFDG